MTLHSEPHPSHLVCRGLPAAIAARGGPGSGHFGHAGRPGERGGSAPSGSAAETGTIHLADVVAGVWSGGTSEQGGRALGLASSVVLEHIANNPEKYDGDLVQAASDELASREGTSGPGGSASGKDRGESAEEADAVRLLHTGTPLTREIVDVLEAMDNSGRLTSEEHDALDNARVYESGTG